MSVFIGRPKYPWTAAEDDLVCQAMASDPPPTYAQLITLLVTHGAVERNRAAIAQRLSHLRGAGRVTGRASASNAVKPHRCGLPRLVNPEAPEVRQVRRASHQVLVARVLARVFPVRGAA